MSLMPNIPHDSSDNPLNSPNWVSNVLTSEASISDRQESKSETKQSVEHMITTSTITSSTSEDIPTTKTTVDSSAFLPLKEADKVLNAETKKASVDYIMDNYK